MKIAKYKRVGEYGYETVSDDGLENCADYIRISEFIEVDFPPLESKEVIQRHLEALDRTETEVRSKFQEMLNSIEQQRAELRAITYKAD
jgi:hypothetical protein